MNEPVAFFKVLYKSSSNYSDKSQSNDKEAQFEVNRTELEEILQSLSELSNQIDRVSQCNEIALN
jgi:hypothetical protein